MHIAELTAFRIRIPLKKAIRHASHARTETENVLVRCRLDNGIIGFGEGVPRDYVTGETIEQSLALLRATDLRAQLEPCRDFVQAVHWAERLRLNPVPGDERGRVGNAARCAVELAVLDAFGQHFGEPLSAVTRILAPELYQPQAWVRYSGVITSARGLRLRFAAWAMRLNRFDQLKVKVGIPGYDDVARLRRVRRIVGRRMDLRIDANEAWPATQAVERITELQPFGITSVEQPVPHAELAQLAEIRLRVQTPIMLDESLCSMHDAETAIALKCGQLFNLRLSKCGGMIPSIRLAQRARQADWGYQLGCQVGETAVLSAAGRHFAASVAGIRYREGSYDRYLVRESLTRTDLTFRWGGWAPALVGGGLGIAVDPEALRRVTIAEVPLVGNS